MIILHARVPIRSEARERWLALLDAVTPVARRRRLPEAIETPNTFIFVEEWASLDGLYAHFHTPHFIEFFAALGDVLAGPPAGAVSELSSTQTLDEAFGGCRHRGITTRDPTVGSGAMRTTTPTAGLSAAGFEPATSRV